MTIEGQSFPQAASLMAVVSGVREALTISVYHGRLRIIDLVLVSTCTAGNLSGE